MHVARSKVSRQEEMRRNTADSRSFRIPLTRGAGELALLTDLGTPTAPADK